jgi:YD repeat-containing protein
MRREVAELVGKTDPGSISQVYRYDAVSNRIGLTDPDGKSITATFDVLNLLLSQEDQGGFIYTPTYDQDSRRTTLTLGTGIVRHYGYDPVGQLTTQIDYSGATPISTMIDGYDPVGNRITRLLDNVPYTWTYDNQYRLKMQQTSGGNASFVYDAVDNMLVKWNGGTAPLTMSFDPATRLTTSIQGTSVGTYTFDNAGSQTLDNVAGVLTTCQYDPENRLLFATSSSAVSSYTYQGYDGLRRSWQELGTSLTTIVWDGSDYLQERS